MLRATVFENGSSCNGKVLSIPNSYDEFLKTVNKAFNEDFKKIYSSKGAEISDVALIRDDETIYVSKGEAFIPVLSRSFGGSQLSSEWIKLNIGGKQFHVSKTTLLNREPNSLFGRMFSSSSQMQPSCVDADGAYLIDRDPKYVEPLINYLRTGSLVMDSGVSLEGVLEEAKFFDIQSCVEILSSQVASLIDKPLSRNDVINALINTSNEATLRFQGVNLTGADLSYLDLRNINFKYAKLRNAKLSFCNLSFCNFERADMTNVEMNNAILSGVRMACAVMENIKCVNSNFQDPHGRNANMEGCMLKNAILEDSDLSGANLRVSNLKQSNLKATILRGAILAGTKIINFKTSKIYFNHFVHWSVINGLPTGADLENADLTGSDLHEANLRGANLKDAALELMINPLHMSQAIR